MHEQRVRDPAHSLSTIKQAIYILRCISVGRTWNDIVKEFDDDEQLVSIWINCLKERNYLNAYSAVTGGCAKKPNLKFYNLACK
jgi:hypothetical protein